MKRSMTVLALLLCVLLSACSEDHGSQGRTTFLEAASGLPEDLVILTVDGREIPAWRYLYWLAGACDKARERYEHAGMELDWAAAAEAGGKPLAAYVKEQALQDTVLYATVENLAERCGCSLTEEETSTLAVPDAVVLDKVQAEELAEVGLLYGKLLRLCREEGGVLTPNAAELAAFAEKAGKITLDRILISAQTDREAAERQAEEVFSKLNHAEDQDAAFDSLAAVSADPAGPRTVTLGDGTLSAPLEQAAVALAEGQFSGILESEEGFSILKRLPPDREFLLDDYFDDLLQTAAEHALVCHTQEYAELDVAGFAAQLNDLPQEGNLR